jgi:hypothetical protein
MGLNFWIGDHPFPLPIDREGLMFNQHLAPFPSIGKGERGMGHLIKLNLFRRTPNFLIPGRKNPQNMVFSPKFFLNLFSKRTTNYTTNWRDKKCRFFTKKRGLFLISSFFPTG